MLKKLFTARNLVILLGVIALFVVSSLLGLQVAPPEVSIAAEPIFHIGSFAVTNALFTAWIVMIILIILSLIATRRYPKNIETAENSELVPSGFGNFVEWVIAGLYGLAESVAGKWTKTFFPILSDGHLMVDLREDPGKHVPDRSFVIDHQNPGLFFAPDAGGRCYRIVFARANG